MFDDGVWVRGSRDVECGCCVGSGAVRVYGVERDGDDGRFRGVLRVNVYECEWNVYCVVVVIVFDCDDVFGENGVWGCLDGVKYVVV